MSLVKLLADINSFYRDYPYANKYKASAQNPGPNVSFLPYAVNTGFLQKSLNFGTPPQYDRPGGSISDQPYFKVDTKKVFDLPMEDIGQTGGPDFYIRGGFLLPKSIEEDEIRLFNFFKSTKGQLWTVQQNVLAKSSPVYLPNNIFPKNIYTPASTLIQAAGNPIGLHVNKMGINPLNQIGTNSYLNLTQTEYNFNNTNRLTILYNTKINGFNTNNNSFVDRGVARQFGIKNNDLVIIDAINPLYNRKRVTNTTTNDLFFTSPNEINKGSLYFSTFTSVKIANNNDNNIIGANDTSLFGDFRQQVPQSTVFNSFLAKSNYGRFNLNSTYGISDNGIRAKDVTNRDNSAAAPTTIDRINAYPIYSNSQVIQETSDSDLIPFYFQVVDNDNPGNYTFLHFRAYIDNFGDNFQSNWTSFNYSGRGENFYVYNNFTRNITLSFKVAVESQPELVPLYSKLNYLASLTAPDYSLAGYMRGNFVKLTVGDYLSAVPGFMTSLTYTINSDTPWNIGRYNNPDSSNYGEVNPDSPRVPMVVEVQLSFLPVHSFLPRKSTNWINNLDNDGNIAVNGKITSPFISLGNENQGYGTANPITKPPVTGNNNNNASSVSAIYTKPPFQYPPNTPIFPKTIESDPSFIRPVDPSLPSFVGPLNRP